MVKPFAIEEVVARLRALTAARRRPQRAARLRRAHPRHGDRERPSRGGGEPVELTAREAQLLELLLRDPRAVVSREAAIEAIWGGAAVENVVDRYVARLRRKLGDPPLIRTVRGVGFMLDA